MNKKNIITIMILGFFVASGASPLLAEDIEFQKNETGLYRDVFDDNVFLDLTSYLHLERLYAKLTGTKNRAANVNIYGEVPNSQFFTNRHSRNRLSIQDLKEGYKQTNGPDLSGPLTVVKGKFAGLNPGFFVEDIQGDKYLFKFDHIDSFEMRTAAEVIASHFMYAIGYNVPQYTIATFEAKKLIPREGAKTVDDSGFIKDLTQEKVDEYVVFLPTDNEGKLRASASKFLKGENIGYMSFHDRRTDDPNDPLDHHDHREIRALRVFASWINNHDQRDSNTLDMVINENGQSVVKHYLIDFNSTLGAGRQAPMFTQEHMADYGEATKAFFSLGWWEKPWQKRWRELDEVISHSEAVGDLDNVGFRPEKFKTQLPYYAFKDMTRADAFWAAKIIMTFSDEDIRALVETGKYSNPEDERYVGDVLIERRDIIGKYWFDQSGGIDQFDLNGTTLSFKDLSEHYGFYDAGTSTYLVEVTGLRGKKESKLDSFDLQQSFLDLSKWFESYDELQVVLKVLRPGQNKPSAYSCVKVNRESISRIVHED